jgi:hypothetical protein
MAGIREQQYAALVNTGQENIEFTVYDKDGLQKSNEIKDVLLTCPTIARPINENLSIEYQRPLKEAIRTTNINPIKLLNQNPTFRYGTFNWSLGTLPTPNAVDLIQPNTLIGGVVPVTGLFCLHHRFPVLTDDKTNHLIKTVLSSTTANAGTDMEIGFAYHVAAGQFNEPAKSRFFLSVGADSTGNGSVDLMYSFTENKFTTGTFTEDQFFRIIEVSNYNNWKRYRTTLRDVSFGTATDAKIEVKLFPLSTNGVFDYSIFHIFIDAFYVAEKKDFRKIEHNKINGVQTELLAANPVNTVTGEYKLPQTFLTNELDSSDLNNINGDYGRKDRIDFVNFTLDRLILQEILNDYRSPVKKYEGEFYRDDSNELPIYFYNKIWVNFGLSIQQDFVSVMIDSMEYDVKNNVYRINMHLPNAGSMITSAVPIDDVATYDQFNFD